MSTEPPTTRDRQPEHGGGSGGGGAGLDPQPAKRGVQFMDLPLEIREMIWRHALPEPRTVTVLVYAFPGSKLAPLERDTLRMALPRVCFESRRVVQEAGYVLAFRDDADPDDRGIWFHPRKDVLERTLWGPGEDWGGG